LVVSSVAMPAGTMNAARPVGQSTARLSSENTANVLIFPTAVSG
jgi:hypothetical protein